MHIWFQHLSRFQISGLKKCLSSHYIASLRQEFGPDALSCLFCPSSFGSNTELLVHMAVEHDQLARVVPPETKRLLGLSDVFRPDQMTDDSETSQEVRTFTRNISL